MARKAHKPDPLLLELLASLGTGNIKQTYLVDEDYPDALLVYGCVEGVKPTVYINEAPHIVETLIHELIHRVRPEWSERSVRSRTSKIFRRLSAEEIERIYDLYLTIKEQGEKKRVV